MLLYGKFFINHICNRHCGTQLILWLIAEFVFDAMTYANRIISSKFVSSLWQGNSHMTLKVQYITKQLPDSL